MHKLSTIALCLCATLLTGCSHQPKKADQPAAGPLGDGRYVCHRSAVRITIDGHIDEPDWQKARIITFVTTNPDEPDFVPATSLTQARLLYDANNLYIAIIAHDKDLHSTMTQHDANLWFEDVLEAFFKPHTDNPGYYEFEVSPRNVVLDLMFPKRGAGPLDDMKKYESNIKTAVTISGTMNNRKDVDDKWVLELAIPFSAFKVLTAPPTPGTEWHFALCRYDYSTYLPSGCERSSSGALPQMNFHSWEHYNVIVFDK